MMDILVVAKTRMSNRVCVGAVNTKGELVRLLDPYERNQNANTELHVGGIYKIEYRRKSFVKPPHVEDIIVYSAQHIRTVQSVSKLIRILKEQLDLKIWKGSIDILFDETLEWTSNGSGYISSLGKVPENSVGFWIPDKPLMKRNYENAIRYSYHNSKKSIKYIGFQVPLDIIPTGTLVRVSLARWWSPDKSDEADKKCYLQLSGWYEGPL